MRSVTLPGALVFVSIGMAFVLTGFNREAAPGLLLAGIPWTVVALLAADPPR